MEGEDGTLTREYFNRLNHEQAKMFRAYAIIDILKGGYTRPEGEGLASRAIGNYGKTQKSYGARNPSLKEGWINELLSTGGVSLAKRTDKPFRKTQSKS